MERDILPNSTGRSTRSVIDWVDDRRSQPPYLGTFDSSTTLCRALARHLHGTEFAGLGLIPPPMEPTLPLLNYLPRNLRRRLYQIGTTAEAFNPDSLDRVRIESIRKWVVDRYPAREYPEVFIGSANGAAIHLAALLGIPWLPQTFLVPVRRRIDPDLPMKEFEWGKSVAPDVLEVNPDVTLHHMFDPNQDRIPVQRMAYFRMKSRELGPAYERFLANVLSDDGTIFTLECDQKWPVTEVDDRHLFQFGGVGGIRPGEYHVGNDQITRFLQVRNASRSTWNPPEPTSVQPEAEWGFEPGLQRDVVNFGSNKGWSIKRLRFERVHDLSPVVAEIYRHRYRELGYPEDRLVVDTFAQIEPRSMLKMAAVPFWLPFTTVNDAQLLENYLETADPYEEIYISLFSHGIESIGLAPIQRWRSTIDSAERTGGLLGVDPGQYPLDFGGYARYRTDFQSSVENRYHPELPISPEEPVEFITNEVSEFDHLDCFEILT